MKNNTEIGYKNAIRAKYEKEKLGDFHSFLENPSPAQLRELCLLKFDDGLDKIDEKIFRIYFKISEEENLRNAIFNYHIPKFKSVGNFLTDNKNEKSTSIQNLNLISALVDFKPRPYNKFSRTDFEEFEDKDLFQNATELQKNEVNTNTTVANFDSKTTTEPLPKKNNFRKKVGVGVITLFGIFTASYTAKDILFPEKQCMEWIENHYELVNCQSEELGIATFKIIKPFDEKEFQRKKVSVCDTSTFVKNGKPIVWYSKKNKVVEFFNMDGENPVNDAELRKVSRTIIENYAEKCK